MSGKRVIELRDVAIYHAENPFGRQSAERLVRSGELVLSEVDFSVEESPKRDSSARAKWSSRRSTSPSVPASSSI